MRPISLAVIPLLVQPIFSFCIYNRMNGDSSFSVTQNIHGVSGYEIFANTLKPGEIQCCHYSNTDCSPKGTNNEPAEFMFKFLSGSKKKFTAVCTTGGAVTLYGDEENFNAICTTADGKTNQIALV